MICPIIQRTLRRGLGQRESQRCTALVLSFAPGLTLSERAALFFIILDRLKARDDDAAMTGDESD